MCSYRTALGFHVINSKQWSFIELAKDIDGRGIGAFDLEMETWSRPNSKHE